MKQGQILLNYKKTDSEHRLKEARLKRKSIKSKELLDSLLQNPEGLIEKRIKHKIQETKEDIPEWYDGIVIRIDKLHQNSNLKTTFEMTYDIDGPEQIYSFPLLTYLKNRTLIVLD